MFTLKTHVKLQSVRMVEPAKGIHNNMTVYVQKVIQDVTVKIKVVSLCQFCQQNSIFSSKSLSLQHSAFNDLKRKMCINT